MQDDRVRHSLPPRPSLGAVAGPSEGQDLAAAACPSRPRVLIADDDATNRKVAVSMVVRLGYEPVVVEDGSAAIAAHAQCTFAAILMDVMMPVVDGLAATAAIRAAEAGRAPASGRRTPILAVTACAMPGDRERCLAAGMDDYLAKPIGMQQLAAALERWVAPGTATVANAAPPAPIALAPALPAATAGSPILGELAGPADDRPTGVSVAPARIAPEMLDREALARLGDPALGGDPELLDELVAIFLADAPARLAGLRAALDANEAAQVSWFAHSFKSSCGSLGALGMQALCIELDARGRTGDLAGTSALMAALDAGFAAVRAALEAERQVPA